MKLLLLTLIFTSRILAQEPGEQVVVYFDFNKYDLTTEAKRAINDFIAQGKDAEVAKIYGFCDWVGSNQYNDSLSVKRVESVYRYLKSMNVKMREEHELRGFGEDFTQSEVQGENRKVLIVFQPAPIQKDPTPALADKVKNARRGDIIKLENINFYNNSARILPKSEPVLYDLLCIMEENPTLKIEIQGHICCQRDTDINDVSTARARAIYNFLIRNKIDRKRLSFKGFGVSRPLYPIPERTEEEAYANRRVEIMIVEQ